MRSVSITLNNINFPCPAECAERLHDDNNNMNDNSLDNDSNYNNEPTITFIEDLDRSKIAVKQTDDGGYIVGGQESGNAWMAKLDKYGLQEWENTYSLEDHLGYTRAVIQTNDGGYVLIGSTNSSGNGGFDFYLLKIDSEGNVTSTNIIEPPTINKNLITMIDILGRKTNNKTINESTTHQTSTKKPIEH